MGPLKGIKIIEMAGIGPGPFCGMILSDLGAEVIRVDRASAAGSGSRKEPANRGKRSIAIDLKSEEGVEIVLKLIEKSDGIFEGFRPGVMERLGLGPDVCLARNPKLVYGRMTGWGQYGPLAHAAGHDINYISLTGALAAIGRPGSPPVVPLNLIGDFGGGGMFLALGLLAALLEVRNSGKGQVIDAAMTDGSSTLMTMIYSMKEANFMPWQDELGSNLLDGGAHFYDTYECLDGKYISIGSIEPQFYSLLREAAGLTDASFDDQMQRENWQELKLKVKEVFLTKSQKDWTDLMEGTDICFAPVLSMEEAPNHPHNIARKTFVEIDGVTQPAPAPRFSRTESEIQGPSSIAGEHSLEILHELGIDEEYLSVLKKKGIVN
ncbi:MAG: CaiB/BaiF CoA-transferase family protein [SAR86 cluster bacterium]|jgi:alpha-methylacyl-CoA racemase|nr:CaiB/BaiF CoA-transferase family protein [SAR86 cluster bacterium]